MITADDVIAALMTLENQEQRQVLMRFFKTGPGEYGEGDKFLGIKVPQTRAVVKEARLQVPLDEITRLLYSPWHEARLCGFLLLVEEMKPHRTLRPTGSDACQATATLLRSTICAMPGKPTTGTWWISHARES